MQQQQHSQFLMNLSILVVDDNEEVLGTFKIFINQHGGSCHCVKHAFEAISLIETHQFDAALCDICLHNDNTGFDFVDQAKQIDPELTIILVTGYTIEQFIPKIIEKRIYSFLKKPFDFATLGILILQASKTTKEFRKNTHITENLHTKITHIQKEKNMIFFNTLTSLSNALEQKDEYTKNHSEIVSSISEKICLEYSDNKSFTEDVVIAARLHDIGKIGIHDNILFKRDKLSEDEYEIIKKHSEMSYKIIKPVDSIGKISEYVLHHHERWNGEGYPHKLKEEGIPKGSRILAVADTFNALTSSRPYRKAQDLDFTLNVLFEGKSKLFDPEIVQILFTLVKTRRIVL